MSDAAGLTSQFNYEVRDLVTHVSPMLDEVLAKSPFDKRSVDYKRLKISIMMNMLENLKKKNEINIHPMT